MHVGKGLIEVGGLQDVTITPSIFCGNGVDFFIKKYKIEKKE